METGKIATKPRNDTKNNLSLSILCLIVGELLGKSLLYVARLLLNERAYIITAFELVLHSFQHAN